MDLQNLPPIVRVLLTTDDTVTRSLQAYFWESIEVQVLSQALIQLHQEDPILACPAGAQVCFREVKLVGKSSGAIYAYAQTHLNLQVLPDELSSALDRGAIGVGELLQLSGLETFRNLLQKDLLEHLPNPYADDYGDNSSVAWRHYSIAHNSQTLMHIKEFFPLASFAQA